MVSAYKKRMLEWEKWYPKNYEAELGLYHLVKKRHGSARADYLLEMRYPLVPRVMLVRRFR